MTRPISVLSVTKSTGGTSFYNRTLMAGLERLGGGGRFTTHSLCLSENAESYAAGLAAQGLSAEAFPMSRYAIDPGGDVRVLRRVVALVRERRADVIYCHGSKSGFVGRLAGAVTGVPAAYRQVSFPFQRRVEGSKAPVYAVLERLARTFGGHMVALTDNAREVTLEAGMIGRDRVSVIRTGIDLDRFRPEGRRDEIVAGMGLDPARPVVGWIGRLEPQKAPLDYAEALGRVAPRHPEAQFVMAGEGRLDADLTARLEALGLSDRVRRLPWQSDPSPHLRGVRHPGAQLALGGAAAHAAGGHGLRRGAGLHHGGRLRRGGRGRRMRAAGAPGRPRRHGRRPGRPADPARPARAARRRAPAHRGRVRPGAHDRRMGVAPGGDGGPWKGAALRRGPAGGGGMTAQTRMDPAAAARPMEHPGERPGERPDAGPAAAPMRLAYVIDSLVTGGAERLVVTFAEAVAAQDDIDLTVFVMADGDTPFRREIEGFGIRVVALPGRSLVDPLRFARLVGALRRHRIEVVHAHLTTSTVLGAAAAAVLRLPFAASVHNVRASTPRVRAVRRRLLGAALRSARTTRIAVGWKVAEATAAAAGGKPFLVIPNAVPASAVWTGGGREAIRAELDLDGDALALLAVGFIIGQKGYGDLIDAFAAVADRHPRAVLLIVGAVGWPDLKADLDARVARAGLEGRVRFLGLRSDVARLIHAADLFVSASHWEGAPVSLLEAMAGGLPCLVTDVGDNARTLEGTGIPTVPPEAPDRFAAELDALLSDPERRARIAGTARERIEAEYGTDLWIDRLRDTYRAMMDGRPVT